MELIKRHPLLTYFVGVFALTWGSIGLIVQATPVGSSDTTRVALVGLPMLLAPGLMGLLVTAVTEGRAGLSAVWARMTHWRVEARWYGMAVTIMPIVVVAILLSLSLLVAPAFMPTLSLLGLAGLVAGFLEEIGWTGYAVPHALARWNTLTVGLVVGILWGLWHGLADYVIRGATLGAFWPITFSLFVLPLVAWRILMVWVYARCHSGPIAQLMHFTYTGSLGLFIPVLSPSHDALVYAVLAGVLWVGVGLVGLSQWQAHRTARQLHSSIG